MASKIRLQTDANDELIRICMEETKCGECEAPEWISPTNDVKMVPPANTAVIVIDVRSTQGAVQIADELNRYIDGVGTEEAGKLVMIPWNKNWWYYSIGTIRLAYIRAKS